MLSVRTHVCVHLLRSRVLVGGSLSRNEVYLKAATFLCRPAGDTWISLFSTWWVLEISRISLALDRGAVESANQLHVHHLTDLVSVLGLFLPFLLLVIHVDPALPLPSEDRQLPLAPFLPAGLTGSLRSGAQAGLL